jgi:hypothetical protein
LKVINCYFSFRDVFDWKCWIIKEIECEVSVCMIVAWT